jgi:hypothetical protein
VWCGVVYCSVVCNIDTDIRILYDTVFIIMRVVPMALASYLLYTFSEYILYGSGRLDEKKGRFGEKLR